MNPERRHSQYVPSYSYKADSLSQWKIERGADISRKTWGTWIACLFVPPLFIVSILGLPIFLWYGHKGKSLRQEGEAEGAEGRGWRGRGSESIAENMWERECGPEVRRVDAPLTPPASLLPASDAA